MIVWLIAGVVAPALAGQASGPAAPGAAKSPKARSVAAPLTDEQVLAMSKAAELTSAVVRAGVEYLYRYKPQTALTLEETLKTNPQRFRGQVNDAAAYARQLASIKDPALRRRREQLLSLEAQAERLAIRYAEAPELEKPQLEGQLKGVLDKVFDARLADERDAIEQLRKDIATRQAALDQQRKDRDRLVDRDLTRRLGISELAW